MCKRELFLLQILPYLHIFNVNQSLNGELFLTQHWTDVMARDLVYCGIDSGVSCAQPLSNQYR